MDALRIETVITSDTLVLPQLKSWQGKTVEIVVTEVADASSALDATWVSPLAGTVTRYDEPFAPAAAHEWEAAQ
jgi:hypothetical protein